MISFLKSVGIKLTFDLISVIYLPIMSVDLYNDRICCIIKVLSYIPWILKIKMMINWKNETEYFEHHFTELMIITYDDKRLCKKGSFLDSCPSLESPWRVPASIS